MSETSFLRGVMRPRTGTSLLRTIQRMTSATEAGCVEWTGKLTEDGYGKLSVGYGTAPDGRRKVYTRPAHRVVWEMLVGPISAGLEIDHLCKNPACVNPNHLEPVTPRENWFRADSPSRRCADQTTCRRGHEFDGVRVRKGKNYRFCRQCDVIRSRACVKKSGLMSSRRRERKP